MEPDTEALYMAFDDDEKSIGLVLMTSESTRFREDGRWFTLPSSSDVLDGAEVVEVDDDFLEVYDKLTGRGIDPTYKQVSAYKKKKSDDSE